MIRPESVVHNLRHQLSVNAEQIKSSEKRIIDISSELDEEKGNKEALIAYKEDLENTLRKLGETV